eukprot:CAMPEP_0201594732 /NCGR_PEP_ID=MMETSP0190_2-20130828/191955_1 /ASSEMBLY_ACC=CAM_ASM_000263 /TAXON_ID=37353 /ORGANISM="Rosalina sp." /LENGTH=383 /DNA_ID=CAMNT_0048054451 /DNA_START=33 /DNA_END=1184 /DNA_ORIENTATION=-
MSTKTICAVNNMYLDTTDIDTDLFSDEDNGDWDQLEFISDDNLISIHSTNHAKSITRSHWEECWRCHQCFTINNVKLCIKEHGSKCLGCQNECYIKFQTETILQSTWDTTRKEYLLRTGKIWECESCGKINDESDKICTVINCDQLSPTTIISRKIEKFTDDERANHLIHGFIREHEYYLQMSAIPIVLFQIIQNCYTIDYLNAGWIIGDTTSMSLAMAAQLKVGDKLDHKDSNGRFREAKVVRVWSLLGVKIHYEGSTSLDTWSDYNTQSERFAEAGSISARPAHRLHELKVGDQVDINPIYSVSYAKHEGWKRGEIKELDDKSGQVKVEYTYNDTKYTYWTHLDNLDEIADYQSMTFKMGRTVLDQLRDDIDNNDMGKEWQ